MVQKNWSSFLQFRTFQSRTVIRIERIKIFFSRNKNNIKEWIKRNKTGKYQESSQTIKLKGVKCKIEVRKCIINYKL